MLLRTFGIYGIDYQKKIEEGEEKKESAKPGRR
jgi:hypothetical protein